MVEHDHVAHPQPAAVVQPGAGPVVRAVEETVSQEDEVPRDDFLPGDLHHLALLHQLSPGSDELKVAQPSLEVEESLKSLLPQTPVTIITIQQSPSYPFLDGGVGVVSRAGDDGEGLGGVIEVYRVGLEMLHVLLQHEFVLREKSIKFSSVI